LRDRRGDATDPGYGPKAPEPSPEHLERLRRAQELRDARLEEQRRHAAEANYGYPTSARPSLIHAASGEESKALAYDAMAKALSSPPVVKDPALPVKAMPPLPPWRQELFMQQMASQFSSMLIESLGMPMPPPPLKRRKGKSPQEIHEE